MLVQNAAHQKQHHHNDKGLLQLDVVELLRLVREYVAAHLGLKLAGTGVHLMLVLLDAVVHLELVRVVAVHPVVVQGEYLLVVQVGDGENLRLGQAAHLTQEKDSSGVYWEVVEEVVAVDLVLVLTWLQTELE